MKFTKETLRLYGLWLHNALSNEEFLKLTGVNLTDKKIHNQLFKKYDILGINL